MSHFDEKGEGVKIWAVGKMQGPGSSKTRPGTKMVPKLYALNAGNLKKVVSDHEKRGWTRASEDRSYQYGLGVLMVWDKQ